VKNTKYQHQQKERLNAVDAVQYFLTKERYKMVEAKKKSLMEAVGDIEEYLLREGFNSNEVLLILRELETTAVTAHILNAIKILGDEHDNREPDEQESQ